MASDAVVLEEDLAARFQVSGVAGCGVRTFACSVEALQVGGEGVEVGAAAGIWRGEGSVGGAVGDETGAACKAADLIFEVLDLVEVACPMQGALLGAAMTAQGDGVAQALTKAGEVPGAAVLVALVMTGGAGDVALQGEAGIESVVEVLFAEQDRGGQSFGGDGAGGG